MASPTSSASADARIPLCVDLDGTLIRTDLLWESLFQFIRQHARRAPVVFVWLLRGRAHLKSRLAANCDLDIALLPFNQPILKWIAAEKAAGRPIILCTAADETLARRVAAHLGLFDEVLASDGATNLKGRNKAKLLQERFGGGFDYAGDSRSDWEIWRVCRQIIAVETPLRLTRRLEKSGRLVKSSRTPGTPVSVWRRALRVHQWVKNLLVFVPIVAAHKGLDPSRMGPALLCFLSFCLVASATYLVNDLLDLPSDRVHPRKRFRPIAAGELSIPGAVAGGAIAFAAGMGLSAWAHVLPLLVVYAFTSLAYSFYLKKRALLDVYVLSGLYTLRLVAGGVAGDVKLTGWFLSFSVFLFLSLGFAKRASELHRASPSADAGWVPGRGYHPVDFQPVLCFGVASAFASALVLSLYLQSTEVQALYPHPQLLWALFPVCLYWLTRVWLLASRGALHEDPISFAIKDRLTWFLLALSGIILRLAA